MSPGAGPWPQQQPAQQQWSQQQWPQQWPPPTAVPPPGGRGSRTVLLVVTAVVLVVAVAAGVTWFVVGQRGTDAAAAGKAGPIAAKSSEAFPSDAEDAGTTAVEPVPEPEETTLAPEPTADPEEEALLSLGELRHESLGNLDLDGRWVAQVASKYVGITDPMQVAQNGSHTFHALDILAEMDDAAARAPSAQMFVLNGSDFGRYSVGPQGQEFWVTLVDAGFTSSAQVDVWCASTYADLTVEQRKNTCAARTLVPSFR
jgi:hypothetical protein